MQQSCLGADAPLKRMTLTKMLELARQYSYVFVIFVASVGGVLFLPTLAQASQAWCAQEPLGTTWGRSRKVSGLKERYF